jgi:branched-chain amino acid transport system substrate-binding protein
VRTVDDLTRSLAAGRLGRRGFLLRAAGLGLSASAAAALLEACGRESAQGTTRGAADVSVAVLLPTSGDYAQFGQGSLAAARLALADINRAGGIRSLGGARMSFLVEDVTSDPTTVRTVTERVLSANRVAAVSGCYASALTIVATEVSERVQVPFLTASVADTLTQRGFRYLFQVAPKASQYGKMQMDFVGELARRKGVTPRVAVVYENTDYGTSTSRGLRDGAQANGFDLVLFESYSARFTDATPLVTKIRDVRPDFVFPVSYLGDAIQIVKGLKAQSVPAAIIGGGAGFTVADFWSQVGTAAQGLITVAAWNNDNRCTGVADFARRYRSTARQFLFEYAGEQYVQIWTIAQALEKAASTDPRKVRDALAALDLQAQNGSQVTGCTVRFDATGWNSSAHPVVAQWQNGELHTIWPAADATVQPVLPPGY